VGVSGTAQIFGVSPIIPETCKATNFKFGSCIQSVHANKSPLRLNYLEEKGAWAYPETAQIFGVAPNFKFGRYIVTGSWTFYDATSKWHFERFASEI